MNLKKAIPFIETGIIDEARMKVIDKNAISLGVLSLQLMESAGKAVADLALSYEPEKVLILCGKGNNGGDGMVAARHLQTCADVTVCYTDPPKSEECKHQLKLLRKCCVSLYPVKTGDDVEKIEQNFKDTDLIVDALLGIGVKGALREPVASCVRFANSSTAPVLSADLPTTGINPDRICSFHRPKVSGSEVADIGIPIEAECFVGPGDLTLLPGKSENKHKGDGGEVLIIGGGPYQGAPYLTALAALRAGADIVRVASPVNMQYPDLIIHPLSGEHISDSHTEHLIDLCKKVDVVVCGNGLGADSHDVVLNLAGSCKKAVFDADSLRRPLPNATEENIYTPHAGEFLRAFMQGNTKIPDEPADRAHLALKSVKKGTVLLKGRIDLITDGSRVRFNRTGNPAMSVGGTGDVLAGVCGALLCHLPAFEAACIAAYVTGKAGDMCEKKYSSGMMATDLIREIPTALFSTKDYSL